jgi:hypothetical protein
MFNIGGMVEEAAPVGDELAPAPPGAWPLEPLVLAELEAEPVPGAPAEPPPVGFVGGVELVVGAGALAACSAAILAVTAERAEAFPAGGGGNGTAGRAGDACGMVFVCSAGLVFAWGEAAPAAFAEEPLEDADLVDAASVDCGEVAADTASEGETVGPTEVADESAGGAPCRTLLKIASLIGGAYRSVKPL